MRGGDLHWLWTPYSLYQDIDYVRAARTSRDASSLTQLNCRFTAYELTRTMKASRMLNVSHPIRLGAFGTHNVGRPAFMNIVENLLNIAYLYLTHVTGSPIAPLIGFASIVMTLSKTVLYWLNEHYCGWCSVGHNDWYTLIVYWIIPNG